MENNTKEEVYDPYNERNFNEEISENPADIPKIKPKISWGKIIFGAFSIAMLFLPSHYLITDLSLKASGLVFPIIILCAAMSFFAVLSETVGQAVLKWVISLPMTFICWIYLVKVRFSIRLLNWTVRDYGEPYAGDSMFFMFMLLIHLAAVGCALGIGLVMSGLSKRAKSEKNIRAVSTIKKVCGAAALIIAAAVLLLDMAMPAYRSVYG